MSTIANRSKLLGVLGQCALAGLASYMLIACSGKVSVVGGSGGSVTSHAGSAGNGSSYGGSAYGSGGTGYGGIGYGAGGFISGTGGTGIASGGASVGISDEVLMPIDVAGFMSDPSFGIQGPWYAYGDGQGPDGLVSSGDCERIGHPPNACAHINTPSFGPFMNAGGAMFTSGTVETVTDVPGSMGCPMVQLSCDYSSQWGAGIGVDLNNANMLKASYNANAHGFMVLGFAFDIDQVPPSKLRVEVPMPTTTDDPHMYLPTGGDFHSPLLVGHNRVLWTDLVQSYGDQVVPFDPTQILSVQFHVPTSTNPGTIPYSFTISNFALIVSLAI
ncbi:MAG TPA: hypothetical protein VGI10_10415 [Polyangiaceae bacterium]|jgi:hypothetical protein